VHDFVRTTLRHPDFCRGWNALVRSGCTDDTFFIDSDTVSFNDFFGLKLKKLTDLEANSKQQLDYLGLFQDIPVQMGRVSSADILQKQLELKLLLKPEDHDMILLMHEIGYRIQGVFDKKKISLVVKGEDALHTAMAKTVGLPLAIAAKLVLNGSLKLRGVHIPILSDVYIPVLKDLQRKEILFTVQM
jgi:saccharopine dehydrogenase (NADP+, L-glutamate forming)